MQHTASGQQPATSLAGQAEPAVAPSSPSASQPGPDPAALPDTDTETAEPVQLQQQGFASSKENTDAGAGFRVDSSCVSDPLGQLEQRQSIHPASTVQLENRRNTAVRPQSGHAGRHSPSTVLQPLQLHSPQMAVTASEGFQRREHDDETVTASILNTANVAASLGGQPHAVEPWLSAQPQRSSEEAPVSRQTSSIFGGAVGEEVGEAAPDAKTTLPTTLPVVSWVKLHVYACSISRHGPPSFACTCNCLIRHQWILCTNVFVSLQLLHATPLPKHLPSERSAILAPLPKVQAASHLGKCVISMLLHAAPWVRYSVTESFR